MEIRGKKRSQPNLSGVPCLLIIVTVRVPGGDGGGGGPCCCSFVMVSAWNATTVLSV